MIDDQTVHARLDSPFGPLTLMASAQGLAGLWFPEDRHGPCAHRLAGWPEAPTHPVFVDTIAQLQAYCEGGLRCFDLPLDLSGGTPFQQTVWKALLAIPFGEVWSYGALAREIDKPKAVRAVGGALGKNPISVIVPCHRVCGRDGALTGFAAGLNRKAALLRIEGTTPNALTHTPS
jgi:methylated-DNA-[protein]-cysteine S-methyltransferase